MEELYQQNDPTFDVSQLDTNTLGHLEYILNSPSYQQVMRPFLVNSQKMYETLLLDPRPEVRKKYGGTNYLRCGANNISAFLKFLDTIVLETHHERAMEARAQMTDEEMHDEAVRYGLIKAAGQSKLSPEDNY